ncbi:MAG: hypothetical protein ACLQLG_13530 [Thermoguttaceae bacterium]
MKTRPAMALLLSAVAALGGCTAPWVVQRNRAFDVALPQRYNVARPPLVIHSDFPLPAHDPLLDELMAQRRELGQSLGLPETAATVQVYLFESAERFHEFLRARHPNFPDRRAFFVETDRELIVYAQGGDRLADDLRHEMTHAYLHSVVPGVPLWLDEGLAKNFELPRGQQGLNPQYVQQIALAMQQGGWHPDLRRLERLPATADMSQEDYVEAWAWVHYLLHSQPACRDLLCQYLAEIGGGARAAGSSARVARLSTRLRALVGNPEGALLDHVRQLAAVVPRDASGGGK